MKQACVQCSFLAVLLAVMAVPGVGNGAAADQNAGAAAVVAPTVVAEVTPVPWPKKPGFVEMPIVLAEGTPTPWPKKPGFAEMPIVLAEGTPTPWPKKPGFVLS